MVRVNAGDVDGARPLLAEALAIFRATKGSERPAAHVALILAEVEFRTGDAARALTVIDEALATDRAFGDHSEIVFDLCNRAAYLLTLGRREEAASSAREALSLASEHGIEMATLWAMQYVASAAPDARLAARLLGFVDARLAEAGIKRDFTEQQNYEVTTSALRRSFGEKEFAALLEQGRLWTAEEALDAAKLVA